MKTSYLAQDTLLQAGKYKIVRFLSSGGFGCTYEGEHIMLHKRIAIKEFFVKDFCNRDENTSHVTVGTQSKVALVEKLRNKFIDEAVALSQLNHPNIVSVSDVFMENGTAYYVMDFIDGKSLHQIVNERGALPESEAISYIKEAAEALKYVHSLNRLHLDIKPGNIMVTKDGHTKLIDFGASKQYDEVDGENTSTLLGKTPGYAPIEQMSNNVKQFTPATDIYSLGATLYKLLTGNTPPDATEIFNEGLEDLPNCISKSTNDAVMKAMELRVKNRPQTIDAFLNLLDNTATEPSSTQGMDEKTNVVGTSLGSEERPHIDKSTTDECEETQIAPEYDEKMHDEHAVDLGLSVKWCDMNLGATKVADFGSYFGWSDPSGEQKLADLNLYPSATPPQCICNTEYDMALTIAGKGWRMPTKKEFEELQNQCRWLWCTDEDGVSGCKITGPNGNSIFLPAAGFRTEEIETGQNEYGNYWTGDLSKYPEEAYNLLFNQQGPKSWKARRYFGFSVRPVKE